MTFVIKKITKFLQAAPNLTNILKNYLDSNSVSTKKTVCRKKNNTYILKIFSGSWIVINH